MKPLHRLMLVVVLGALAAGIGLIHRSHRPADPGPKVQGAPRAPSVGVAQPAPLLMAVTSPIAPAAATMVSVLPDPFGEFDRWVQRYQSALSSEARDRLVGDGERLAAARHAEMVRLVRSKPDLALARALPYGLRKILPPSLTPHLEQPIDTRGSLQVIHSVPLPEYKRVHLPTLYRATVNKTEYETFTFGNRRRAPRRTGLPLHGIAVTDAGGKHLMALSDQPLRLLEEEEAKDRLAAAKTRAESRCRLCTKPAPATAVHADCGGEIMAFCSVAEFQQASRLYVQMEDASAAPKYYAAPAPVPQATSPDQLPPPTPGIHIGAQKLLIIPVEMAYDPIPVTPVDELWRACEYNNQFYVENSYGIMSWISTVSPTVKVPEGRLYYAEAPESVYADAIPRAVALGYNPNDYFMTYVVFNSLSPSVRFGGRSDGLFNGGPWAIDHELGHNIGVIHANYLNTSGVNPGPPYPPPARPAAPYPVDLESTIGHDDINAPVVLDDAMEVYGDPYDRMGGGGGHFSVYFKYLFDWLPANFLRFVNQSATNRIYAFDTPNITDGRAYGIRIPKNPGHEGTAYWMSYRQAHPDNPWMENGLYVQWEAGGNILLMDTTPLTFLGKYDGSVVVGRTFHDPEIRAHITAIAKGSDGPSPSDKWMDVVVNIGTFPENVPPSFTLTSSPPIEAGQIIIPLGGTVTLGSQAQDPDGDLLGYYWEFGDLTVSGSNSPVVTKTYATAGKFNLRHEVSDLRGGVVSRNLTVVVGDPGTHTISGYVTDELGNPLPNVVVHNCGTRPEEPDLNEGAAGTQGVPDFSAGTFRSGVTDSDGYYIIGNVSPGVYTCRAFRFGYTTQTLFNDPVRVTSGDVVGLNYLSTSLPHVSIERTSDAVEGATGGPGSFIARRTGGDLSVDLPVKCQITGTANAGVDYESFLPEEGQFVIPAWSDSVVFNVNPIDNGDATGPRTVTVSLFLQPTNIVIGTYTTNVVTTNGIFLVTNTVFLYVTNTLQIPGWQTNWVGSTVSEIYWFQTYPTYVLGGAQATVNIQDDEPEGLPTVTLFVPDSNASETREDTAVVGFARSPGDHSRPLTVRYSVSGTAVNGDDIYTLPGTVVIPANEEYVLLPVKAVNDLFVEGNEALTLTLEPDPAYEGFGSADLTVVDDDLPQLYVYSTDSVADKTGNRARVTIARSGDLRQPLLVNYLVSGTAVNVRDYLPLPGSVTIPAGQVTASIEIIPVTTSPSVGAKSVVINISDSTTYNIDSHSSTTVTIQDRLPVVTVSPGSGTVAEGGTISVTFTRTGDASNALLVYFAVGGTAVENFDFAGLGTNVLIPAGSLTKTLTINASDDAYREMGDVTGNDVLEIQLVKGPDYNLGGSTSTQITITDNDGSALPGIGFMTASSTVREDEGVAWVAVRVTANPATNRPARVDCIISGGTAVANTNYVPFEGGTNRFLFVHYEPPQPPDDFLSPQNGIQFVVVPILQDGVVTTNKTIQLRLLNPNGWMTNVVAQTNTNTHAIAYSTNITRIPTNAFISPYTLHTVTIQDVDQNWVSVNADAGYVYEAGPVGANFIITREGAMDRPLTVHYAVPANVTDRYTAAAPGNDYVAFTTNFVGSITIPAGTNRVLIPIIPLDDPTEESAEPIAIELLDRPGYQVGTRRAQVILVSNDGTVQFARANYQASEGAEDALLEVVRSGDTNLTVSFEYNTADGSALNPQDYRATNGTLVFLPGEVSKTVLVPLVNDTAVEPDETFFVHLVNTGGGVPLGGQRTAVVTVLDEDIEFTFATNLFRAPENSTNAVIEVIRLGLTNTQVSVRFLTQEISTNQHDYVATNRTLVFSPGQTNHMILLPLLDDAELETNETVRLVLTDPSTDAALGPLPVSTLTIVEDDCAIGFSQTVFSINEYVPSAILTVERRGGTVNPITVDFFTYDGTASNGIYGDYFTLTGTVNFRPDRWEVSTTGAGTFEFVPGDSVVTIAVQLNDDYVGDGTENFFVALTNLVLLANAQPGSAVFDSNRVTTVSLIDDEMPGAVDYPFNLGLGPNGPVHAVALQTNQSGVGVVFAGDFTTVDGINFLRIARWTSIGVLDPSFNPGAGANDTVLALTTDPGGKVLVGGRFTSVDGNPRFGVARLNADGNIDTGFNSGLGANGGVVRALVVQRDGRVIVGGEFGRFGDLARENIARLQTNGAVDTLFTAAANGPVYALARDADGRILLGGAFTRVGGVAYSGIARLTTNGTVDTSFSASANLSGAVYSIAIQSDGKILAGGALSTANGSQRNLVRLDPNGTLDSTFVTGSGPDGAVNAVAAHPNGRIYLGGAFTHYNGADRNGVARLQSNGALDFVFNPGSGPNALVRALVAQPDTAIVIGGDFTEVNSLPRKYVARLHGDEKSLIAGVEFELASFRVREDSGPGRITLVRSGNTNAAFEIEFATADGTALNAIDYVGQTNSVSFEAGEMSREIQITILNDTLVEGNESVNLFLINPPRLVELGGNATATLLIEDDEKSIRFSQRRYYVLESATNATIEVYREGDLSGEVSVTFHTENGSASAGIDYGTVSNVLYFAEGETNKIIVIPIEYDDLAEIVETVGLRLSDAQGAYLGDPDMAKLMIQDSVIGIGAPDPTFDPGEGANSMVRALTLMADAKVLVGGAFTTFDSSNRNFATRLNFDGTLDDSFKLTNGPNASVAGLGTAPDGTAVMAGAFTGVGGVPANRVGRLRADGAVETLFNSTNKLNAGVVAVALQPDGKMVVVGSFSEPVPYVARLRVDGAPDISFNPGLSANAPVHAVCVVSNGVHNLDPLVVIGGVFSQVNGFGRSRVARLKSNGDVDTSFVPAPITNGMVYAVAVDADGRVLIGGSFTNVAGQPRNGIARLTWDGALDTAFDPGLGANATVWAVTCQANGKILIGGDFTEVNGVPRKRIARLLSDGVVDSDFDTSEAADGTVYSILVLPDNKVMIGGSFTTVNGVFTRGVARLMGDPPPPLLVNTLRFAAGHWRVTINSRPESTYILEASSDLVSWTRVAEAVATGYVLDLVDPDALGTGWRYYRVGRLSF